MVSLFIDAGEIAVSSHSKGLIGVTQGGLGFGPIVTPDDPAEIS